jgi:hypothetical protein
MAHLHPWERLLIGLEIGAFATYVWRIPYYHKEEVALRNVSPATRVAGNDISTPPMFRPQGFGKAITWALMLEIRNRGSTDSWIWSSHLAKSVYQKVG